MYKRRMSIIDYMPDNQEYPTQEYHNESRADDMSLSPHKILDMSRRINENETREAIAEFQGNFRGFKETLENQYGVVWKKDDTLLKYMMNGGKKYRKVMHGHIERCEYPRNTAVRGNLGLIFYVMRKHKLMKFFEDSFQQGVFGLTEAVERFDLSRGTKFSTYAYNWIRQSIVRANSNGTCKSVEIRIPVHIKDPLWKLENILDSYLAEHGKYPDFDELCAKENLEKIFGKQKIASHEDAIVELLELRERNFSSLEYEVDDKGTPFSELLVFDTTKVYENVADSILVRELLLKLPEKEREIIEMRYGLGEYSSFGSRTLEEIANITGVTRERIRQIEQKGIARLKENVKQIHD
ncbi:MAG: sigma-70 family RNA polymerase sigma factor [Candidatus Aenigmarchaeota archaeon]|nr:sigma-70 family RNA polymerase sigma factor [Candidatus Aenigmarchaeota archaeon]